MSVDGRIETAQDAVLVHFNLPPSETGERAPCTICCVVDTSGSMGSYATLHAGDDASNAELNGLTVLDVVKHSIKTILSGLEERDQFALVEFNSNAKVAFQRDYMTAAAKKRALAALDRLDPDGNTNLWGGLSLGLDLMQKPGKAVNSTLLLLTDGEPTIIPPSGHISALNSYIAAKTLPCSISTFGFGYDIDTSLLVDIARVAGGTYSFIPDSSLVGTVFVNSLSKLLSTSVTSAVVQVVASAGATLAVKEGLLGNYYRTTSPSGATEIHLGSLCYGQQVNLLLPLASLPHSSETYFSATLSYFPVNQRNSDNSKRHRLVLEASVETHPPNSCSELLMKQKCRNRVVSVIRKLVALMGAEKIEEAQEELAKVVDEMRGSLEEGAGDGDYIHDLLADLEGQVSEAVSKMEWYKKWGRHYLPSLLGAHLNQHCNNFKDPGVQHYVGDMFCAIRDKLDEIFLQLPPPQPQQYYYGGHAAAAAPQVDMHQYYNRSSG